ncbi:toxin-antitoxin system, toxin component, HicA domain protein [Lentilactobacillus parafarraginis F0439]|uniref:Toxin-antitoxin system, toxin component, HicA domain protein n=1 Tax=Lentilactobacillus parafarraginis F0439 TaxID=797515 RepID=G9ZLA3_9LACO|nr:toxin-antitoxin system, toxin component, HicA domain protein [Lentilactobacillus parafarraginis F0439]
MNQQKTLNWHFTKILHFLCISLLFKPAHHKIKVKLRNPLQTGSLNSPHPLTNTIIGTAPSLFRKWFQ